MREPYILFRRPDGAAKGKMYYVEFWDKLAPPRGRYVGRRSVGSLVDEVELEDEPNPLSKAGGRVIVDTWRKTHTPESSAEALKYLEGFWLQGGSYSQRHALDSSSGKPLSSDYLYNCRNALERHFRPFLEGLNKERIGIGKITPKILTDYKLWLSGKGLAAASVNNALKAVLVPLGDYWDQAGAPERSPARLVTYASSRTSEREILTIAEAGKVFTLASLSQRDRLLLQLSAFAGLRVSEACAMRPEHLLLEGWDTSEGRIEYYTVEIVEQTRGRSPKAGSSGEATIPFSLGQELLEFYKTTWGLGWLFDGKTKGTSMQKKQAELISNAAILKALEITDETRVARGLTFHSWRHWYVSYILPATSRDLAQKLARHRSGKMTDHYTHLTIEERRQSAEAGAGLFGKINSSL